MNPYDLGRLNLGIGAKTKVIAPNATTRHAAQAQAPVLGFANTPAAAALTVLVAGATVEKFMWGVHGFPPDDTRAWIMGN